MVSHWVSLPVPGALVPRGERSQTFPARSSLWSSLCTHRRWESSVHALNHGSSKHLWSTPAQVILGNLLERSALRSPSPIPLIQKLWKWTRQSCFNWPSRWFSWSLRTTGLSGLWPHILTDILSPGPVLQCCCSEGPWNVIRMQLFLRGQSPIKRHILFSALDMNTPINTSFSLMFCQVPLQILILPKFFL